MDVMTTIENSCPQRKRIRELGISSVSVLKEETKQNIQHAICILDSGHVNKDVLIETANVLMSVFTSPVFLVPCIKVLDQLSSHLSCGQDERVLQIYSQLSALQSHFFNDNDDVECLPAPVLYRLWLSYLPSLEFVLLLLVNKVMEKSLGTSDIHRYIRKCRLVKIGSQEPVIHHTVCSFLADLYGKTNNSCLLTLQELYQQMVPQDVWSFCKPCQFL